MSAGATVGRSPHTERPRGNTLLNSTAVRDSDTLFAADRSPNNQGCFLLGSPIPIVGPDHLAAARPDYLLILTWDLRDEILHQMGHIREWGGRFVVPLPELSIPAMTMFIGQLALVTGGGQGIGRAIAVAGASVIIVGRRPDPVADAVALIRGAGGSADGLALDRVKTQDRATLVADIDGRSAGPDVLVHSVGTIARVGGQALPARAPLAARGHRLDRLGPRSIRPARPRSPS